MTKTTKTLIAFGLLAASAPITAQAQDLPDVGAATGDALTALRSAGEERLLVRPILGAKVMGPDGSTVGTVEDLVVVPGGRIIAALVRPSDGGQMIPVPYAVVKLSKGAEAATATLPQGLDAFAGGDLASELQDVTGSSSD